MLSLKLLSSLYSQRPFFFCLLLLTTLILFTSCQTSRIIVPSTPQPSPIIYAEKPLSIFSGKASFYHEPQRTTSGERFNPNGLTAAHKTLPLGTAVRVTNLRNHKSTIVKINDRGPNVRHRLIDLSPAAAKEIQMISAGVVPVTVEVLQPIAVMSKSNLKKHLTKSHTSSPKA